MNYHAFVEEHGGIRPAARALNMPESTLRGRLNRRHPDPAVSHSMESIDTLMVPSSIWIKSKTHSVQLKPKAQDVTSLVENLSKAFANVNAAPVVEAPELAANDLCSVYPIVDTHFGMMAWDRETGDLRYDLDLAREDMETALASVTALTPDSERALLILGGDILHADDNRAETPKSKHKLDMAGRHYLNLETAISIIEGAITTLLKKHQQVDIRVLRGNHDEHAHLVLHFALLSRYRDNPRCNILDAARDLLMYQWGNCAIFAQHGDKAKPQQLNSYLSDVCPFWSATRHRHVFTGHVHHGQVKDLGSMVWESLRAFCPPDAYAASMSYASRRALQSITFHKTKGVILRGQDPIDRVA